MNYINTFFLLFSFSLKSGMSCCRWNLWVRLIEVSPSLPPPPAPPLLLPVIQSTRPPHPKQPTPAPRWCWVLPTSPKAVGWRRWQVSGAPPMRFLSEWQPVSISQWDKVDITVFMTQQLPVVDVGHLDSWLAVWPRSPTLIQLLHTGIKDLDSCEAGLKNGLKLLIQPGSMLVTSASVWLSQLTSTAAKRH